MVLTREKPDSIYSILERLEDTDMDISQQAVRDIGELGKTIPPELQGSVVIRLVNCIERLISGLTEQEEFINIHTEAPYYYYPLFELSRIGIQFLNEIDRNIFLVSIVE
ncbi:MAG: hypothetical protein JSV04_02375 [Candidatus Heimdallarchaeota archaeon]|nr:MAG: hypothetical protein JSV04_02375 [Candidatus Heimdallarchaeota archaeon]